MNLLQDLAKVATRVVSQAGKELIQIVRRPAAFFSLILGPFLLMALFGAGFTGTRSPLATTLVIPPDLELPRETEFYQGLAGAALIIRGVVATEEEAQPQLASGEADVIVAAPADAISALREGRRAEIRVTFDEIDPALDAYARVLAFNLSQEVNREIITRAVVEGEAYAVNRLDGTTDPLTIPPDVVAAPTTAVTSNLAPIAPGIVQFFAPAVLALILQHMAVTLSALSLVRERLSGTMELFRISPITSVELLLGKYLGFGIITTVIASVTVLLVVLGLGVPLLGSALALALVVALVGFASLGLGLLISVVADSERQAVQLSLLVLLASVFFSGFVLPVADFRLPVQFVAYALPVTHGIALLQSVMLRGASPIDWHAIALAVEGLVLLLVTALLLRRHMRRGVRG